MYFIKNGREIALAFTYRGALRQVALAGADVLVLNLFGRCIAGRKVAA